MYSAETESAVSGRVDGSKICGVHWKCKIEIQNVTLETGVAVPYNRNEVLLAL